MSKKVISTFFSIAFLLFITAPTILIIVDDTIDVSVIFSTSEEEESCEKDLNIEMFFTLIVSNQYHLVFKTVENNLEYFDKKYTKPHFNIISPPPDFIGITV